MTLARKIFIILVLLASVGQCVMATPTENPEYVFDEPPGAAVPDTILDSHERQPAPPERPTLVQKLINYFSSANEVKPTKKFDFSFIGGPYYSSDTKLGIGLVAAGLYRRNLADTINPAGQFNLYGDVSITGYYKVGVRGLQYFSGKKYWLNYDASFESFPDKFWGIGYDMDSNPANETSYKRWHAQLDATFLINVFTPELYVGPRLLVDFLDGKGIKRPELWLNQRHRTFTDAVGLSVVFDSRDNAFNATRGLYFRFDQTFAPRFLGNHYAFSASELTFSYYHGLWSSATFAGRFHTRLTYGNTPWGLMSKLGGSTTMRGYYEGRYNDKCAADLTVELRQHLFGRFGMVAWAGVGEVFRTPRQFFNTHLLWNAGIGVRWEFKHRVNIRVDYGFGQGENGLIFNINEAF